MNSKNELQEICQKAKASLPHYETFQDNNMFSATVEVIYNIYCYRITGKPCVRKTDAQMSAASEMLKILKDVKEREVKHFNPTKETHVLVDIENIHMGDFFEHYRFNDKVTFVGFATSSHPSISVCPPEIDVRTIKSDQKDAADILLIGYCCEIMNEPYNILIVTKDHFGQALVDYVHSRGFSKCKSVRTLDDLISYFSTSL